MDTTFAELGLNEHILAGVAALGFEHPTPVQAAAIPAILEGKDVLASAQTGTGKTAAFALPVLQNIELYSRKARVEQARLLKSEAEGEGQDGPDVIAFSAQRTHRTSTEPSKDGAKPAAKRRRRYNKSKKKRKPAPLAPNPHAKPFGPFALIITPTRELATQIEAVVSVVCKKTSQRAVVVTGGAKFKQQIRALEQGCDLLVATPGRLIDLMEQHFVDLTQVKVLVLDEADRMLDMGFWPSVRTLVKACPSKRQTLLFSATIPPSIKGTVDAMLNNPTVIEIAHQGQTADTVEEHLCPVVQGQKIALLKALIADQDVSEKPARTLVFCRTKQRVDSLEQALKTEKIRVSVMHSDRPQKARVRALEQFRNGAIDVLVATDVMSRGIDIQGIDAVVNFDVPLDPEDYVHRIGRTGRAGATGHAYTFVAPDEISPLREIEYFTKQLIPTWDLPGFAYAEGRIVPNSGRSTTKQTRPLFSGSRSRGRGLGGGRYGRHY